MIRMLSANDASLLSAGVNEPLYKKEAQHLLNLIESEVRFAAASGRNKAALLNEEFKGWDCANATDSQGVMSLVFQVLIEEGYAFHTEQVLQIGNNASTCSQVPYPHIVVTWPWCPDDGIAEGFRGAGKTELLTQEAKDLLEGRPLSLDERTKIADSLGKDLEYVNPAFAQPTMPPMGVFPPTTLPAPGTPMQLIEYLRQKGYKMQGFGCLVEVKHKPTNWDTCRAIGSLVLNLLEVHRSGSPKEPTTSLPLKDYPEIDFKYLRGTFAEVGLLVHQNGDTIECRWPVSAWDYNPVAPVAANTGDW